MSGNSRPMAVGDAEGIHTIFDTVQVLQEHIKFLRGLVEEKKVWYDDLLMSQRREIEDLKATLEKECKRSTLLRAMLAQAAESHYARNCSSDVEVSNEEIDLWIKISQEQS